MDNKLIRNTTQTRGYEVHFLLYYRGIANAGWGEMKKIAAVKARQN